MHARPYVYVTVRDRARKRKSKKECKGERKRERDRERETKRARERAREKERERQRERQRDRWLVIYVSDFLIFSNLYRNLCKWRQSRWENILCLILFSPYPKKTEVSIFGARVCKKAYHQTK